MLGQIKVSKDHHKRDILQNFYHNPRYWQNNTEFYYILIWSKTLTVKEFQNRDHIFSLLLDSEGQLLSTETLWAHSPWQDLPDWQCVMWFRTFFIVRQWGRLHCLTSPLACSLRWHLWACKRRTSCCWMSLRFSGSAVWAPEPIPWATGVTRPGCWTCGACCWP